MKPLIFLLFLSSITIVNAQSTYKSLEEAIKADPKDVYRLEFDASEEEEWIEYISSLNYVKFMFIKSMKEFSPEILKLSSLSHLEILESSFTTLPDVEYYSWMTSLRRLKIDAELTSLPETFGDFPNLEYLNLKKNSFTELPCCIVKLRNLSHFIVVENQIKTFPNCLQDLNSPLMLELWGNKISEFPSNIGEMQNLTKITLSDNDISEILSEIINLTKLDYLDLSNNPIETIPIELVNFNKEGLIVLYGTKVEKEYFKKLKEINPDFPIIY